MTPASKDFVTSYLIHFIAVHSTFFNRDDENEKWNNHVELGLADIIISSSYSKYYVEDGKRYLR
jgi:phosphopantothenoylcysteine decarboxylase/phosphopantothenate--cysteine ligase